MHVNLESLKTDGFSPYFWPEEATGSDKTVRVVQLIIYGFWVFFFVRKGLKSLGTFSPLVWLLVGRYAFRRWLVPATGKYAAIGWAVLGSSTLKAKYLPLNSLIIVRFLY